MRWELELVWQAEEAAHRLKTGMVSLTTSQLAVGRKPAVVPSFPRKLDQTLGPEF